VEVEVEVAAGADDWRVWAAGWKESSTGSWMTATTGENPGRRRSAPLSVGANSVVANGVSEVNGANGAIKATGGNGATGAIRATGTIGTIGTIGASGTIGAIVVNGVVNGVVNAESATNWGSGASVAGERRRPLPRPRAVPGRPWRPFPAVARHPGPRRLRRRLGVIPRGVLAPTLAPTPAPAPAPTPSLTLTPAPVAAPAKTGRSRTPSRCPAGDARTPRRPGPPIPSPQRPPPTPPRAAPCPAPLAVAEGGRLTFRAV